MAAELLYYTTKSLLSADDQWRSTSNIDNLTLIWKWESNDLLIVI